MDTMQLLTDAIAPLIMLLLIVALVVWFVYFIMSNSLRWKKLAKKTNLTYIGTKQEPIPSELTNAVSANGYNVIKATLLLQGNKDGHEWNIFNCFSSQSVRSDKFWTLTVISVSTNKSLPQCYITHRVMLDNLIDKIIKKNTDKIASEIVGDYTVTSYNTVECKRMISKIKPFLQENNLPYTIEINGNKIIATITRRKMSFYKEFPNELIKIEQLIRLLDSN